MKAFMKGFLHMIGNQIKKLRQENKLLQKELAEELNLTQQTISSYESNKREPDSETLQKIAQYFDVSVDYLLGISKERTPADKIKEALSSDPELLDFWDKLSDREDLQELFKKTKNKNPEEVKRIIRVIKAMEDEYTQ